MEISVIEWTHQTLLHAGVGGSPVLVERHCGAAIEAGLASWLHTGPLTSLICPGAAGNPPEAEVPGSGEWTPLIFAADLGSDHAVFLKIRRTLSFEILHLHRSLAVTRQQGRCLRLTKCARAQSINSRS